MKKGCLYLVGGILILGLALILLAAVAPILAIISGIGIWLFSTKSPNPKMRNISLVTLLCSLLISIFLTPSLFKEETAKGEKTNQSTASISTLDSTTSKSTSISDTEPTKEAAIHYSLSLNELDSLGRATGATIILQAQHKPKEERENKINIDPVGWHNYEFYFEDGSKKAWLMSRAHLISYQFSGLNDEIKNLVPMTNWLNAGNYDGTNIDNSDSMLYYEQRLNNWLEEHPASWLFYRVTPLYTGEELLPRQIKIEYAELIDKDKYLPIDIGGKSTLLSSGVSEIILENHSPNATLDYSSGTAINTVESAEVQQRVAEAAAIQENGAVSSEQLVQDRIVYVARNGTAEAYWYDINNMPRNTNFNKVVQMTEQEAINLGKYHTSKE
ncbi:TPA: DNA/RNA non-specific endonuclease [Streptococcus suis]